MLGQNVAINGAFYTNAAQQAVDDNALPAPSIIIGVREVLLDLIALIGTKQTAVLYSQLFCSSASSKIRFLSEICCDIDSWCFYCRKFLGFDCIFL